MNEGKSVKLDKTKNTVRGIVSGLLNKVITLLIPFVVRTLLIQKIGIEYAGINSLFTSILNVLNLAELGFASAVVYSMYKPIAYKDDKTICALLNFYRKIYTVVGWSIFAIGLFIMPFIHYFINGEYPKDINLYIVYFVFLLNTVSTYLFYGYKNSVLNAYQRIDVISNINSITTLILNFSQILILLFVPNFYLYVILIPILTLANCLITSYQVDKLFPQYRCIGMISAEMKADIKKKVTGLMIQKLCVASRNTFSSIFISIFISLVVVGVYNNYFMVINAITSIFTLVPAAMVGGIGNNVQISTVEENHNTMKKFNCMYMWLSTIVAVCLFLLFQPFMEIWMGKEYMFDMTTVGLFVIYFYMLKIGDIRSIWLDAAGLYWEIKWRAIWEAVLNLILSFVLIQVLGINGVLIGTIISLFTINFLYGSSITFKYYFGYDKLKSYYITQMFHIFIMFISALSVYYLCNLLESFLNITNIWSVLIYRLFICISIPNVILYLFLHKTDDYELGVKWLKMFFLR